MIFWCCPRALRNDSSFYYFFVPFRLSVHSLSFPRHNYYAHLLFSVFFMIICDLVLLEASSSRLYIFNVQLSLSISLSISARSRDNLDGIYNFPRASWPSLLVCSPFSILCLGWESHVFLSDGCGLFSDAKAGLDSSILALKDECVNRRRLSVMY